MPGVQCSLQAFRKAQERPATVSLQLLPQDLHRRAQAALGRNDSADGKGDSRPSASHRGHKCSQCRENQRVDGDLRLRAAARRALLERLTHHVHPSCITQNTPRIFYEMPAGGLVLLRHNTAEHRRLVAYFLSAANTASNPLRKSFAFVTLT